MSKQGLTIKRLLGSEVSTETWDKVRGQVALQVAVGLQQQQPPAHPCHTMQQRDAIKVAAATKMHTELHMLWLAAQDTRPTLCWQAQHVWQLTHV